MSTHTTYNLNIQCYFCWNLLINLIYLVKWTRQLLDMWHWEVTGCLWQCRLGRENNFLTGRHMPVDVIFAEGRAGTIDFWEGSAVGRGEELCAFNGPRDRDILVVLHRFKLIPGRELCAINELPLMNRVTGIFEFFVSVYISIRCGADDRSRDVILIARSVHARR